MKNIRYVLICLLCCSFAGKMVAQHLEKAVPIDLVQEQSASDDTEKYWIFLTDKGADWQSIPATEYLSPRAIARREKHSIPVSISDVPVRPLYRNMLAYTGADVRQSSKWFNAVSAYLDADALQKVLDLPFVKSVKPIAKVELDMEPVNNAVATKYGYQNGLTRAQVEQLGLEQLHQNGYNGKDIVISVMDNGFLNANTNPFLQHLFDDNRILATWDFVNNEEDVFNGGWHGQAVLSIMAGWYEDATGDGLTFYGSAHGATYILCHTENDFAEEHQEEDNWVAAMEFADSAGADIFTTSLGYRDFDNGDDYGYEGLDGNTTIITRGADMAAAKGIIVLNSAGNSGLNKITAPADGDSVIAVGAVDSMAVIAGFSSRGPSYDGRIKPDICAMGRATAYLQSEGAFSRGNGTSFSCPMAAGFTACLLQTRPETQNMDIYDVLIRSSDRYDSPDTVYGYGIPNAAKAYELLNGEPLPGYVSVDQLSEDGIAIFPNPATDDFKLVVDNDEQGFEGVMELFDMRGKRVYEAPLEVAPFYNVFRFNRESDFPNLRTGHYVLRIRTNGKIVRFAGKISLHDAR